MPRTIDDVAAHDVALIGCDGGELRRARHGVAADINQWIERRAHMLLAQQPNKHFASAEELGALTVFLASEAAVSITGIAFCRSMAVGPRTET